MSLRRVLALRALPLASLLSIPPALFFAPSAAAFCGFFVSGASDGLKNSASQVVLLRNGNRTIMTMSNNYQGPPENFAMVVPVPVVLKKEDVKTLDRAILQRVDQLSAPRLVEYWERDPCEPLVETEGSIGLGNLGTIGRGSGGGGAGYGNLGVKIEAQFAVGEYEIVILSAEQSTGLEKWLHLNNYKIPVGAAAAMAPYIRDQQKFFVAKVDIKKVKRDSHGSVVLSPLRFSFDAPELRLPVRLGLLNAQGAQDLLVYILHPQQRFEVANYPNVFIPTNVEVADSVRKSFPSFYADLFDATLQQHKNRAIVTEYAWQTTSCDPCPVPPLSASDMATLGADGTISGGGTPSAEVAPAMPKVDGALDREVVRRIVRRHINELRFCYEKELSRNSSIKGQLVMKWDITDAGSVENSQVANSTVNQPAIEQCFASAVRRWEFPKGKAQVEYPFTLQPGPPRQSGFSGTGYGRFGGSGAATYVLTRLHARYDKQALSEDLIFRAADPVLGGRANWDGTLGDQGAQVSHGGVNNFQGRYIIRHYWEGKVACATPNYGRWGGPWAGLSNLGGAGLGKAQAGVDLANAPRGQVQLKTVVRSAIPSLGISAQPPPARPGPAR